MLIIINSLDLIWKNKKENKQEIFIFEFPNLLIALGLHPDSNYKFNEYLNHKKVIALGEIGLEYYQSKTDIEIQKYWFTKQLKLAKL